MRTVIDLARQRWVTWSRTTAPIVTEPRSICWAKAPAAITASPLAMTASSRAPSSVPITVPWPPCRLAPPMITAANVGNSRVRPESGATEAT